MAQNPEGFTRREAEEASGASETTGWQAIADALFGADARSHLLRYGSHALVLAVGVLVIWLAGAYARLPGPLPASGALLEATPVASVEPAE